MGQILDTNDELLGLEERRESFYVFDLQREPDRPSEHIFAYEDGYIEVSKEFLLKLVTYFDNPDNRKRLEEKRCLHLRKTAVSSAPIASCGSE